MDAIIWFGLGIFVGCLVTLVGIRMGANVYSEGKNGQ